jgi:hypothetical protein
MRVLFALACSLAISCGFGDNGGLALDAGSTDGDQRDGGTDGPIGACSVVPQAGCPTGQACDFGDPEDGPHECRAISEAGTVDDLCTDLTDCAAGFTCVGSGTRRACDRFCDNDSQCGLGSRCVDELLADDGDPLLDRVCSNSCNVLAQTGCPTGFGCGAFDDGDRDFTDCEVMGTRADGQTCTTATDCRAGSLCVNELDGETRCHAWCNLAQNTCTCTAFSVAIEINSVALGFCQ